MTTRCDFCSEAIAPGTAKCPHCGEGLVRPAGAAPTGWGSPGKPMLVAVVGVLHLGFGALGLCGQLVSGLALAQMGGNPVLSQAWGPPGSGVRTFMTVSMVIGAVSSVLHVAAGVGLLGMRPWGRKLALALALVGAAMTLLSLPISLPMTLENMPTAQHPFAIGSAIVSAVFSLGYQALVVALLTRPHVGDAFEGRATS